MKTQKEKGEAFRALHRREGAFIIPNPWDAGTARMLAQMGFEALATTSAGNAFAHGQEDGTMGREATLENAAAIVAAADVPVNGDLENGFGDSPEMAAETIRMAAEAGRWAGRSKMRRDGRMRPFTGSSTRWSAYRRQRRRRTRWRFPSC